VVFFFYAGKVLLSVVNVHALNILAPAGSSMTARGRPSFADWSDGRPDVFLLALIGWKLWRHVSGSATKICEFSLWFMYQKC